MNAPPVIAIDGPAGVGKTSVAATLATRLGFGFLTSGMMYRAFAHLAPSDADFADPDHVAAHIDIAFDAKTSPPRVLLGGEDLTEVLGDELCALRASEVAARPEVRTSLLAKMREFRRAPGLVAEGRDMATVVFTDAALKIYLDAPRDVRVARRHAQLKSKGISDKIHAAEKRLATRDKRDGGRAVAPLTVADGAHVIDTAERTIDSITEEVLELFRKVAVQSDKGASGE